MRTHFCLSMGLKLGLWDSSVGNYFFNSSSLGPNRTIRPHAPKPLGRHPVCPVAHYQHTACCQHITKLLLYLRCQETQGSALSSLYLLGFQSTTHTSPANRRTRMSRYRYPPHPCTLWKAQKGAFPNLAPLRREGPLSISSPAGLIFKESPLNISRSRFSRLEGKMCRVMCRGETS